MISGRIPVGLYVGPAVYSSERRSEFPFGFRLKPLPLASWAIVKTSSHAALNSAGAFALISESRRALFLKFSIGPPSQVIGTGRMFRILVAGFG